MKITALFAILSLLSTGPRALAATASLAPARPRAAITPLIDWPEFFSSVRPEGVELSEKLRQLDGKKVRIRGFSLIEPRPRGGVFLTRLPAGRLHPDDFDTLPWDTVAVLWRSGLRLPPIPRRPTVEGTLRLGNRKVGDENVFLLIEDAVPSTAKPLP